MARSLEIEEKYVFLDIDDDDETIEAYVEDQRAAFYLAWEEYVRDYE